MLVPLWAKIGSGQKRWWQFVGAEQMQMPSPDTDAKSTRVTLFKKRKKEKSRPTRLQSIIAEERGGFSALNLYLKPNRQPGDCVLFSMCSWNSSGNVYFRHSVLLPSGEHVILVLCILLHWPWTWTNAILT